MSAPKRLTYYAGSRVVHVLRERRATVCGLITTPAERWTDEGTWDGRDFETMCGRCRQVLVSATKGRSHAKTD